MENKSLKRSIRIWIIAFIVSLLLSGITAFAVETELHWLLSFKTTNDGMLHQWLQTTYIAIKTTNETFPYMAYGYDWLAFAHIVIATVFIGPLIDPVRNKWVVQFGCIACIMVFPLAFIAGHIRHIPFFWQCIDCSFGIIGIVPLMFCYKKIQRLEALTNKQNLIQVNNTKA